MSETLTAASLRWEATGRGWAVTAGIGWGGAYCWGEAEQDSHGLWWVEVHARQKPLRWPRKLTLTIEEPVDDLPAALALIAAELPALTRCLAAAEEE